MSLFPLHRNGFDPDEPDKEGFTLSDAVRRSYDIAAYSLMKDIHAEDVSLEVAKRSYLWWRPKFPRLSLRQAAQNRAFLTDVATHRAMEGYKQKWVGDGTKVLNSGTVDLWYLESIINYVIERGSMFAAVGIGNVLFNYENTEIQLVFDRLHSMRTIDDSEFRRAKGRILKYFKPKSGGRFKCCVGQFLTIAARREHKNEERFVARSESHDDFAFVIDTLSHLTPLKPDHPFPPEFRDGSLDPNNLTLENWLKEGDAYKSSHGLDRGRVHAVIDPHCWVPLFDKTWIVKKSGSGLDDYERVRLEEPERKLEMPDYSSQDRINLASPHPQARSAMRKMSETQEKRIKERAAEWDQDRKNFSALTARIIVNDDPRQVISLGGSRRISNAFALEEDENVIDIFGTNRQGHTMLLGSHFIPWDKYRMANKPIRYRTKLAGHEKLDLLIRYAKDEFGYPVSAVVTVNYIPRRSLFTPLERLGGFGQRHPAFVRVMAVAVVASLTALVFGLRSYWISERKDQLNIPNRTSLGSKVTPSSNITTSATPLPSRLREPSSNSSDRNKSRRTDGKPAPVSPKGVEASRGGEMAKAKRDENKRTQIAREVTKSSQRRFLESVWNKMKKGGSVGKKEIAAGGTAIKAGVQKGNELFSKISMNVTSPTRSRHSHALTRSRHSRALMPDEAKTSASAVDLLCGMITDAEGQAVVEAIVSIKARGSNPSKPGPAAASSNRDGKFTLRYAKDGTYDLIIEKDGFATVTKSRIKISRTATTVPSIDIKLERIGKPEQFTYGRGASTNKETRSRN